MSNELEEQKKFFSNVVGVLRNDLALMADQKATQYANVMQANERFNNLMQEHNQLQIKYNEKCAELDELKEKYAGPVPVNKDEVAGPPPRDVKRR